MVISLNANGSSSLIGAIIRNFMCLRKRKQKEVTINLQGLDTGFSG